MAVLEADVMGVELRREPGARGVAVTDAALRRAVDEYLAADRRVRQLARVKNTYTDTPPRHVLEACAWRGTAAENVVQAAVAFCRASS